MPQQRNRKSPEQDSNSKKLSSHFLGPSTELAGMTAKAESRLYIIDNARLDGEIDLPLSLECCAARVAKA